LLTQASNAAQSDMARHACMAVTIALAFEQVDGFI
jgi:hypothetical protein